jgi:hypothetical protein
MYVSHPMPIIKPLFALSSLLQLVISGDFWPHSPPPQALRPGHKKNTKDWPLFRKPIVYNAPHTFETCDNEDFLVNPTLKRVSIILTMLI